MLLPEPPSVQAMDRISPSRYEAALKCTARASWLVGGNRRTVPGHPRAILGTAHHATLEAAHRGQLPGATPDEVRVAAGRFFDERMQTLHRSEHPLLRAKFSEAVQVPYYNLYRARVARRAADLHEKVRSGKVRLHSAPLNVTEATLTSRDGRIVGRPDLVDNSVGQVVDYKTGAPTEDGEMHEHERRQLRLYAFLARESGHAVNAGVIERSTRDRQTLPISAEDGEREAQAALATLDQYNAKTGRSFESVATPSPAACRRCPCIPFCNAFWLKADSSWADECGTHIQGDVTSVDGAELVSIRLTVSHGSGPRGPAVLDRYARAWLRAADSAVPDEGRAVRIVDVAQVPETEAPTIFRSIRASTAVWLLPCPPPRQTT